ncbi:MAG: uroporphyrinogen decarboxylase [Pseudomonadales bacterium]|nr:uroporphyrinogen decarboxylase [Pseudomonadales bacterium]
MSLVDSKSDLYNSVFLKACRGEQTAYTPIWLNRQAGRYMPEYHQVKGNTPSLDFFKTPELAAKATLDAQRILGVDAAIMFADLLPILEPMGLELDYIPGVGPNIANPIRKLADIDAIQVQSAAETMPYIGAVIALIRAGLPADIPLIGFGGAPFTLASYAIEGKGSRNYVAVKQLMYGDTVAWHQLMEKISDCVIDYMNYQIESGVQAIQLFDSWVGCLAPIDYQQYVFAHTERVIQAIKGQVPVIYFGTGNPALAKQMAAAGCDVLGLDWRSPLVKTWDETAVKAVQGNLDPIVLCATKTAVEQKAKELLDEVDGRAGHIFNLGHGIIPETPVENVKALVDFVHTYSARSS